MKPVHLLPSGLLLLSVSIFIDTRFYSISDTLKGLIMGFSIGILIIGLIKLVKARRSAEQRV